MDQRQGRQVSFAWSNLSLYIRTDYGKSIPLQRDRLDKRSILNPSSIMHVTEMPGMHRDDNVRVLPKFEPRLFVIKNADYFYGL